MALNVKKGDTVLVIAGKDKGKTGKVLVSLPANNSVVVAGVNMISKHKKPRSANDKGGIIKKEGKIDASNVQIVCPTCGKATRINHTVDGEKKIRSCKKCGANLDVAKKTTKEATKTTKTSAPKADTKKVETAEKTTKTTTAKKEAPKSASKATSTASKKETATKSTTTKKTTTTKKVEK